MLNPYPSGRRTLTGAWIETAIEKAVKNYRKRRTLTGAWIETIPLRHMPNELMSRTLTGAWIETDQLMIAVLFVRSHPHGCVD